MKYYVITKVNDPPPRGEGTCNAEGQLFDKADEIQPFTFGIEIQPFTFSTYAFFFLERFGFEVGFVAKFGVVGGMLSSSSAR